MKVLHILDHSLPYFSGYSFRSDAILRVQRQLGLEPVAVTSPKHEDFTADVEIINGIEYHRTHWPPVSKFQAVPMVKQTACLAALAKQVKRLAAELKVDVIHAHSPSLNGLAAAQAAKALDLPLVYELRYYEEDAAVDRGKTRYNSLRYRLAVKLEQQALEQADRVVTISRSLRDDLVRRGISPEKIVEVPNGVDADFFQPGQPDAELIRQFELSGKTVIGFIGSFYFYEGLEYLIDAGVELLAKRNDLAFLLVGSGESQETLKGRIPDHLRGSFLFSGNVPHDEVRRYYSVMDVLVYPRKRSRLTELTTPLKPLEAMAMGKAVVGSNVAGIRELVGEGVGCLVDPEDTEALARQLSQLIEDQPGRVGIGERAREFMLQERSWKTIVARYIEIYGGLKK